MIVIRARNDAIRCTLDGVAYLHYIHRFFVPLYIYIQTECDDSRLRATAGSGRERATAGSGCERTAADSGCETDYISNSATDAPATDAIATDAIATDAIATDAIATDAIATGYGANDAYLCQIC